MNNNELYHYGVPGMKWGVRHETEKTYNKSHRSSSLSNNSGNGHTKYADAMKAKGKEPLGKKKVNEGKPRDTPKKVTTVGDKIVNVLEDSEDKLKKGD